MSYLKQHTCILAGLSNKQIKGEESTPGQVRGGINYNKVNTKMFAAGALQRSTARLRTAYELMNR